MCVLNQHRPPLIVRAVPLSSRVKRVSCRAAPPAAAGAALPRRARLFRSVKSRLALT